MKCFEAYKACNTVCDKNKCKYFINSNEDLNCTIIAANTSEKTFEEIAKMYSLTKMRICQIQHAALGRLQKTITY